MKLSKSKNKPVVETQMVSLADIAFLIIFFFMLTSQFMRDKIFVPLPVIPDIASTKSAHTVTLTADKQIFLDGDPVSSKDDLEGRLRGMVEGKTDAKEIEVRLKCDRDLTFKDYKPMYDAIANAGGVIAVMHNLPSKPQE